MNQERIDIIQHEMTKLIKLLVVSPNKLNYELKDGKHIHVIDLGANDIRLYIPDTVTKIASTERCLSARIKEFLSYYYDEDTQKTIKIYGGSGLKDTHRMFYFLSGNFILDFTYFDTGRFRIGATEQTPAPSIQN